MSSVSGNKKGSMKAKCMEVKQLSLTSVDDKTARPAPVKASPTTTSLCQASSKLSLPRKQTGKRQKSTYIGNKDLKELLTDTLVECKLCGEIPVFKMLDVDYKPRLRVECAHCNNITLDISPKDTETLLDKSVAASKSAGRDVDDKSNYNGFKSLKEQCVGVANPPIVQPSGGETSKMPVHYIKRNVHHGILKEYPFEMDVCVSQIFQYYKKLGIRPDTDGNLNIDVAFAKIWIARDPDSRYDICAVMEKNTGFVVDVEIMISFCSICHMYKEQLNKNKIPFTIYTKMKKTHKIFCMNADDDDVPVEELAVKLWGRSLDKKLRYTKMFYDCDTDVFKAVMSMNGGKGPYDVPVTKENSINHFAKNFETRLSFL